MWKNYGSRVDLDDAGNDSQVVHFFFVYVRLICFPYLVVWLFSDFFLLLKKWATESSAIILIYWSIYFQSSINHFYMDFFFLFFWHHRFSLFNRCLQQQSHFKYLTLKIKREKEFFVSKLIDHRFSIPIFFSVIIIIIIIVIKKH